jgi:hypothetical protein
MNVIAEERTSGLALGYHTLIIEVITALAGRACGKASNM